MQDDYSYQTSLAKSEHSERKQDDFIDAEDEEAGEIRFRSVMSQYEMKILTKLFPKCAQTLARVLRNRPQRFEDEL